MKRLLALALLSACAPNHDAPRHVVAVPETTTSSSVASTTTAPPSPPKVRDSRATRSRRPRTQAAGRVASSDLLDALARCESGGDPALGGRYRGAWQWLQSSWDSHVARMGRHDLVGKDPATLSYEEQKQVTAAVPVSAWGTQFSGCARKLGVR